MSIGKEEEEENEEDSVKYNNPIQMTTEPQVGYDSSDDEDGVDQEGFMEGF